MGRWGGGGSGSGSGSGCVGVLRASPVLNRGIGTLGVAGWMPPPPRRDWRVKRERTDGRARSRTDAPADRTHALERMSTAALHVRSRADPARVRRGEREREREREIERER